MPHLLRFALPALLLATPACNRPAAGVEPLGPGGTRVLFVGNSLTYFNDLPAMLASIAASVDDTIRTRSVALANFAVIDHAVGTSDAASMIRGARWDFVVLQQGPTPAGLDRDTLLLATRLLAPHIAHAGAAAVHLMTWPSRAQSTRYPLLFDETYETCRLAAAEVPDGICAPAGDAWRQAWNGDPYIELYGGDGYHPSPLGSWVAALTLYETITGRDVRELPVPARIGGVAVSEARVRMMQRAAHEAVGRLRR